MLQKISALWNSIRPSSSSLSRAEQGRVEEALSQLVLASPDVVRATLVSVDGLAVASFPRQSIDSDRISAMGAAMLSLGERICHELCSGQLRYAIIAGDKTMQLLVVLNQACALELELRPNVSIDAALERIVSQTARVLEALGGSLRL